MTEERLSELQRKYAPEKSEVAKTSPTKTETKSQPNIKDQTKFSPNFRDKIIELVLFVGGTFIFVVSLTGGYYNYSKDDSNSLFESPFSSGYSSSSGFKVWSVIGMAIGISMIVLGFLRRSWSKKGKNE